MKLRESISCFTNLSLVLSMDWSLNTLTRRMKASPAMSFMSVDSRYLMIASGNFTLFRNWGTTKDGRYSFNFLNGFA